MEKHNDLTLIKYIRNDKDGNQWWLCQCICGNKKEIRRHNIRVGHTKSCGCRTVRVSTTHGMSSSRFYSVWRSMIKRCFNSKRIDNKNYKDRGIAPCKRWLKFENFRDDQYELYKKHSKIHGEKNTSFDRIDNDKGYTPSNCRWATAKVQANNRRDSSRVTYKGENKTISQWAEIIGINRTSLYDRLHRRKWSVEEALTTPKLPQGSWIKRGNKGRIISSS